jgi:hypothetical protein
MSRAIIQTSSLSLLYYMCPHTTIYLSIYPFIYMYVLRYIEIYWETAGAWGVWVSRCRERRELLVYALTYHQNSRKKEKEKIIDIYSYLNSIYALIYIGIYRLIYRYIPIYRYIEEGGLCAVCTPITAADGSRHRYIHRYMPI